MVAQWTVPSFGHCNFTAEQTADAFGALVRWVHTGQKPADAIK
jgi:hypothetical protein